MSNDLSRRQRQVLDTIVKHQAEYGYPPSVREIGDVLGLKSPASVKNHLDNLSEMGYVKRDTSKPRALRVCYEGHNGNHAERRPSRHIPLVGEVAAGADVLAAEHIEELIPMPSDFTGTGELFMLRIRGESMTGLGLFDGDYVVCRSQTMAKRGEVIVAGIPGEEATVKTYDERGKSIVLVSANPDFDDMVFDRSEVSVSGIVVTMIRKM